MKLIKLGVALITMFCLLLGTASAVSAKAAPPSKKMLRIAPGLRFMLLDRALHHL